MNPSDNNQLDVKDFNITDSTKGTKTENMPMAAQMFSRLQLPDATNKTSK